MFAVYVVIIFLQELFWYERKVFYSITRNEYYAILGIPIQFIFFYWLYALKSLKKPKLFTACILLFVLPLILKIYFDGVNSIFSLSLNLGTVILIVLMILEFVKQIKNDNILLFRENKMFYINIGLILFYLGTYPFHIYNRLLYDEYNSIWNGYYIYFLITNCILYLLFAASFIWGKEKS